MLFIRCVATDIGNTDTYEFSAPFFDLSGYKVCPSATNAVTGITLRTNDEIMLKASGKRNRQPPPGMVLFVAVRPARKTRIIDVIVFHPSNNAITMYPFSRIASISGHITNFHKTKAVRDALKVWASTLTRPPPSHPHSSSRSHSPVDPLEPRQLRDRSEPSAITKEISQEQEKLREQQREIQKSIASLKSFEKQLTKLQPQAANTAQQTSSSSRAATHSAEDPFPNPEFNPKRPKKKHHARTSSQDAAVFSASASSSLQAPSSFPSLLATLLNQQQSEHEEHVRKRRRQRQEEEEEEEEAEERRRHMIIDQMLLDALMKGGSAIGQYRG